MDIKDRRILVLGGWGLVGTAVLRKLIFHKPKEIIILSLHKEEAENACSMMRHEAPNVKYTPEWGNIFVRTTLKDLDRAILLDTQEYRQQLLTDAMEPFTDDVLNGSFLNQVITKHKPQIIIDAVNTATGLAYQDIYSGYYNLKNKLNSAAKTGEFSKELSAETEKMLTTLYIPQIIRHIQILHASMVENKTGVYIKIGTTGTGGMGLNIPYTHSEERPSRVLLSKSSLSGAHTMLLFLMGRTPNGPICKEVKPAAAIAWKQIRYGEIKKHGQPIGLFDCSPENAETLGATFHFEGNNDWTALNETLKSVYIDTGENGIFSTGEFETITTAGQMEFVTPEEIAENVILEILGDSTGYDIINALDNSIMGPTYRAGYMRHQALMEMESLQKQYQVDSVAFEILGPPRLSKLLYEAYLLSKLCGDIRSIMTIAPDKLAQDLSNFIEQDQKIRSQIISIGIPILMPDGKRLLRGPEIKVPVRKHIDQLEVTAEAIDVWASAGWLDLREKNMHLWQRRIEQINQYIDELPKNDSSSLHHHGVRYWGIDQDTNIGKVAAWIFIHEDKGARIKR